MQVYQERRWLRTLEKWWARGEGYLNRLTLPNFNPLYHLGTLAIFLLLVLAVTGAYLTVFYRPGADRAYQTVAGISASWLGSLMRSTHRYAADGLILVILLHALKMFLGDRFWGSRWLAWVSGWALLALVWFIGTTGYWLVWDQQAQWLTEYVLNLLKGPTAVAFLTPEIASRTFAFFVIILFLHVFLGILIILGVLVHELRLARARYWAPRWLMVEAGLALLLLALWRPVSSAAPADLSRLVGTVTLDGWYLGFLPLAARWGNTLVWALSLLILGGLIALPWLARGRDSGPAVVREGMCTGCALCFQQCPYNAIEMRPNTVNPHFETIAVVNEALCTGCGLCVGTCSQAGIELADLPTTLVWNQLRESLADARNAGISPVVIFTCQRHAALDTLPAPLSEEPEAQGERGALVQIPALTQVAVGGTNPHPKGILSLATCALPCVGMVQPEWVRQSLAEGASAAVVLSCPADDCAFREGPAWLATRLGRRRSLLKQGVHWLAAAPGDRRALMDLLTKLESGAGTVESGKEKVEEGWGGSPSPLPLTLSFFRVPARSLVAGLVLLALTLGLSLAAEHTALATPPGQGQMRVVLVHPGQLKASSTHLAPEVLAKLPPGTSPDQVLGGERFPVGLRLEVDGELVVDRLYQPGGLRHEGQVYGLVFQPLPPGSHQVRLWVMDDGTNWRLAFSGPVTVRAGRVSTLLYSEEKAAFVLHGD